MRGLRVVSRIVTGLYFLSFVCLLLTTHAWREMAGIASYGFLVMLAASVLMSAIKWRCRQRWKRRALEDQVCRHGLAGPEHRRVGLDRTKIDLKPVERILRARPSAGLVHPDGGQWVTGENDPRRSWKHCRGQACNL